MENLSQNSSRLLVVLSILFLSGCAGSIMQSTDLTASADPERVLVNFVRSSIFFGDGVNFSIWDSEQLVGVQKAGSIIQYETSPGEHVFMSRTEAWAYMKANLKAGHEYFIRPFPYPGIWVGRFGLAPENANTSEDIDKWFAKLKPIGLIPEKAAAYTEKKLESVRKAVAEYENGEVTYTEISADFGRPWVATTPESVND